MFKFLEMIELVAAFVLIFTIMFQNRGTGLGETFGGDGGNVYSTRRSMEKVLFNLTIFSAVVFFGSAISLIYIS